MAGDSTTKMLRIRPEWKAKLIMGASKWAHEHQTCFITTLRQSRLDRTWGCQQIQISERAFATIFGNNI